LYLPRIGQVENMSVEGLFVHGGDLWRLNTPLSCLQPPQQGKTLIYTVFVYTENVHVVSFGAACITGAIKSWLKRVVPSAP
ncbi:hypothetical protein ACFH1Q_24240, partial [Raoultella ornithinolytica]|uniref:hypothetical protein n=1 Tax=Raoultella ornithinolytica TaxID=54291 RepID=UPI00361F07EE